MAILINKNFNIEWINFPDVKNRAIKGVYMIGDNNYIGASKHIRKRILSHLFNAKRDTSMNVNLKNYISIQNQNKLPIKVTFLSEDTNLEREFQNKLMPNRVVSKLERSYNQIYKDV